MCSITEHGKIWYFRHSQQLCRGPSPEIFKQSQVQNHTCQGLFLHPYLTQRVQSHNTLAHSFHCQNAIQLNFQPTTDPCRGVCSSAFCTQGSCTVPRAVPAPAMVIVVMQSATSVAMTAVVPTSSQRQCPELLVQSLPPPHLCYWIPAACVPSAS